MAKRPPRVPSAPKSDRAPNYRQAPSHAQQRDPKAMLARGLGTSYRGQNQGPPGVLIGRGAVRHDPSGNSSWSGPPEEQRQARRMENHARGDTSPPKSEQRFTGTRNSRFDLKRAANKRLSRG